VNDGDAAVASDDVSCIDRLSLIVNGLTSTPALQTRTLQPPTTSIAQTLSSNH